MGLPSSIGSGSRAAWYSISEAEGKGKVESSVRQSVNQSPVVHRVDSGLIDMQIRCVLHPTSQQPTDTEFCPRRIFVERGAETNRLKFQGEVEEGEIFKEFYLPSQAYSGPLLPLASMPFALPGAGGGP